MNFFSAFKDASVAVVESYVDGEIFNFGKVWRR